MKDPFHQQVIAPSPLYAYNSLGFQLYKVGGKYRFGPYGGDKGFRDFLMMAPLEEINALLLFNADFLEDVALALMKFLKND